MATRQELEERLQKLEKLRELMSLRQQLSEAQKPLTVGQRAGRDVKDMALGFASMATIDPTKIGADMAADEAINRAAGGVPRTPVQQFAEATVGPSTLNVLRGLLSTNSALGPAAAFTQAGVAGAREIEEHPVTAPLEFAGAAYGAKAGIARVLAANAARRAAIESAFMGRQVPRLPAPERVPLGRQLTGPTEPQKLLTGPNRPALPAPEPRPALPAPETPVRGAGFVMSEPETQLQRAARTRADITPKSPQMLLEHKAVPLLEGPIVGPEGPNQFIARKPPVTWAEVAAQKSEMVRQAVDKAIREPASAPQAFKDLAEKMQGKRLSPSFEKGWSLEKPGPPQVARVGVEGKGKKARRVIKEPTIPPAAIEFKPQDVVSRKAVTAQRIAGGAATTAIVGATLLEPEFGPPEDNTAYLMGSVGSIRGALSVAAQYAKRGTRFLHEARARFTSPAALELMDKIEYVADPMRESLTSRELRVLKKHGLGKVSKVEKEAILADRLELRAPQTPLSRKIAERFRIMRKEAVEAGIDMGEVTEGYFRRQLTDDVAQKIFDDLAPLRAKYEMLGLSDDAINADLAKLVEGGERSAKTGIKLHPVTARALKHIVDKQHERTLAEALRGLRREAGRTMFAEAGWEKARKYTFPAEFYERDASKVLVRYIESWAKRVAEVRTFGANGEVAAQLIGRAADYGVDEARFARHVLDAWSGDIEFKRAPSAVAKRWQNRYTAMAALTKIGFGFATLKNVFQTAISTAEWAGWSRTMKAIYQTVTSPEHRNLVDASGALNRLALESLAGYVPPSRSQRVAQFGLKYTGFHGINVFNQYVSGITAANWIPELHSLANGKAVGVYAGMMERSPWLKSQRVAWAKSNLKRMGVDWRKSLNEEQLSRGVYRFTTDTQLQRNVVRDPLNRTDPRWRPYWTLKGFGVRQFHFQKNLLREELRHKNLFPIMRLLTGGVAAGVIEQKIEKIVRSWLNGRPPQESDKGWIGLGLDALAAVGAWSFVTDLAAAENKLSSVLFVTTPIQVSEFTKGVELLERVWRDADMNAIFRFERPMPNKSAGDIAMENAAWAARQFGGTFPREAWRRQMTEDQRKAELSREVGEVKDKLFRAAMAGDKKAISRIYKAWLNNWPQRPLNYGDIGPRAFADWLIKKRTIENRAQFRGVGVPAPVQTLRQTGEFKPRGR